MFSTVAPSIESINETLNKQGYTGFYLQPSPGKLNEFQVQREDGSYVEDTLSEGEATIISFLYFMQLVEHNERGYDLRSGKVVVFDDPISSLDYDAIELVSTETNRLIFEARREKNIEKDDDDINWDYRFNGWIEQVIVLTHNTTFHQLLSVRQARSNTRYWRLYKKNGVSKVKCFGGKNPVNSEYKEMWMTLKEEIEVSDSMHLPNTMRRIIETYFVDFGGYDKNALFRGKYCKTKEDKMMVTALMKGADEGSHGAKDNVYSGNREMICERYLRMFKGMFEVHGHLAHYEMMMGEGSLE
jgi:wobble nucleotide-excising tRNase